MDGEGSTLLDKITPYELASYIVIVILTIIYFRNMNISIGVLFGGLVAIIIVYFVYRHNNELITKNGQLHQLKVDHIIPQTNNIHKYKDITDFVFSIQDFYSYNPQVFEHMVQTIDIFFDVYENSMIDISLAGENYAIAERRKQIALNDLHSIIIIIPSSKKLIAKLDDSVISLEELLNEYLIQIYEKNKEYIQDRGFFNNTKIIELNIKPYNTSKDEPVNYFD